MIRDYSEQFDENALLASCALRFDGPRYLRDHPHFKHQKALEQFFASGEWPKPVEERMAIFFLLQLCSAEAKNSKYWRAYRELFLTLNRTEVPARYLREEYWLQWRQKYNQVLNYAVAFIREIHEQTEYDLTPAKQAVEEPPMAEEERPRASWFARLWKSEDSSQG